MLGQDERTKKFKIKLIPFVEGSMKFFNNYSNIKLNNELIVADIYDLEENVDENTLVLQKEEVDDIKWMSSKEVDQLYKNNKFKKTHYKYFTKLKSIIKNN